MPFSFKTLDEPALGIGGWSSLPPLSSAGTPCPNGCCCAPSLEVVEVTKAFSIEGGCENCPVAKIGSCLCLKGLEEDFTTQSYDRQM